MSDPADKTDWAERLVAALGRRWRVERGPNIWRCWRLSCGGYDFCCAQRKGDLPRVFVRRLRETGGRLPWPWAKSIGIPDWLRRCGSAAELKLVLEAAGA